MNEKIQNSKHFTYNAELQIRKKDSETKLWYDVPTHEVEKIEQNQTIVDEIKWYYELSQNNEIEGNTKYDRGFNNSREQDKICLDEINSIVRKSTGKNIKELS